MAAGGAQSPEPKAFLRSPSDRPAQVSIEVIDGFVTQVRQVAAASPKRGEKILFVNAGVGRLKGRTHSPIQPGVRRVEEAPRGGRRFANEQQLNAGRPERFAQSFALPFREHPHTTSPAYLSEQCRSRAVSPIPPPAGQNEQRHCRVYCLSFLPIISSCHL